MQYEYPRMTKAEIIKSITRDLVDRVELLERPEGTNLTPEAILRSAAGRILHGLDIAKNREPQ